jgi:hypothetical protein
MFPNWWSDQFLEAAGREGTEAVVAGFETVRVADLTQSRLGELCEGLLPAFQWYAPASTTKDVRAMLTRTGADETWLQCVSTGARFDGFSVFRDYNRGADGTVMYRAGTCLLPRARGNGIYRRLIAESLTDRHTFVCARTQSQRVYDMLASIAAPGQIYPAPGELVPPRIYALATTVVEGTRIPERDTLIVRDAFGFVRPDRAFMESNHAATRQFFESQHLGRDDGFVLVAGLTPTPPE